MLFRSATTRLCCLHPIHGAARVRAPPPHAARMALAGERLVVRRQPRVIFLRRPRRGGGAC
eukprot:710777-Prymnesium_polylepis.1